MGIRKAQLVVIASTGKSLYRCKLVEEQNFGDNWEI